MGISKRGLAAVACASIVVAACSSAPVEQTDSTGEAVYYKPPNPIGHPPIPPIINPACEVVYPRLTCPDDYVAEAWAVRTANGQCPPITTAHGTWAQIFTRSPPAGYGHSFNGVPGVDTSHWFPPPSPDCSKVASAPCCTYVYWPNGWPYDTDPTMSDPGALCTSETLSITPMPMEKCPVHVQNGVCQCASPGGAKCDTCVAWEAPITPSGP